MNVVLVHGAWHGGWCWERVAALLRAQGDSVFAPTLAGLAERAPEAPEAVTLTTHIEEIARFLEQEDLRDVCLVGHSYGGLVVAGVADRAPHRLRQLGFLDGVIVPAGQRWCDTHRPREAAARIAAAGSTPCGGIPPPDASKLGLTDDADLRLLRERLTPQPLATYTEPLRLHGPFGNGLPKFYIDCRRPASPNLEPMKTALRRDPAWHVVELEAGHDAMLSAPRAVVDALDAIRRLPNNI